MLLRDFIVWERSGGKYEQFRILMEYLSHRILTREIASFKKLLQEIKKQRVT